MKKLIIVVLILLLALLSTSLVTASSGKFELEEKRTNNSKHFLNLDGSITAEIYQIPIHYKSNGKWIDINPVFEAKTGQGYEYAMTKNEFKLFFPKVSAQPYKIELDDAWISFQPLDVSVVNGQFVQNHAIYKNAWKNCDVEYISYNSGLKENIIIKSLDWPSEFKYRVILHNLSYEQAGDGRILFRDKSGKVQAIIPKGSMEDAKGAYSESVNINVESQGNNIILSVIPDKNWLLDKERVYPVKVDPTVTVEFKESQIIGDTYITNYTDSPKGSSTRLEIGNNKPITNWYYSHSYLKFDVSSIPGDAMVTSAVAKLYLYDDYGPNPLTVTYYEALGSWNESTLTCLNQPTTFAASPYQTAVVNGVGYKDFPLAPYDVQNWVQGNSYNHGFSLKCNEAETVENLKYFCSDENTDATKTPKLVVTYEGGKGYETYWPYKSFDLGIAGELSVNLFTRHIVYQTTDISIPNRSLDLNFSRYYNSLHPTISPLGRGWSSNVFSNIAINTDNGTSVSWIHGDGSIHVYRLEGSTYVAPYGLDFQLTYNATAKEYTFKNAEQKKWIYCGDSTKLYYKKLIRQEDRYGNKIFYNYDLSTGKLTSVTDTTTNGAIQRTHSFYYTNDKLTSIVDPMGKVIYFTYNGDNLETFKDFGGHVTTYIYDSQNRLEKIKDPKNNETWIAYLYGGNSVERVLTADESIYGLGVGKSTSFIYETQTSGYRTKVTEPNGNYVYYYINENGTTSRFETQSIPEVGATAIDFTYKSCRLSAVNDGKTTTYYEYTKNTDGIYDLTKVIKDFGTSSDPQYANDTIQYTYDDKHNLLTERNPVDFATNRDTIVNTWATVAGISDKVLQRTTDAEGNFVDFTYNNFGQVLSKTYTPVTGQESVIVEYGYDDYGNLESIEQPLNSTEIAVVSYLYDYRGLLTSVTEDRDSETKYQTKYYYDDCGLLTQVSQPMMIKAGYVPLETNWTKYKYDNCHNLIGLPDAELTSGGLTASEIRTYNKINLVEQISYKDTTPNGINDGNIETYKYDENRRLRTVEYGIPGRVDITETYNYNAKNQLTRLDYTEGNTIRSTSFEYDQYGNKIKMIDLRGNVTYEYDEYHRLTKETTTDTLGATTRVIVNSYVYDQLNNVIGKTTTQGTNTIFSATYTYNRVNMLTAVVVSDSPSTLYTVYDYNNVYNVTCVTYPDFTEEKYSYDKAGRITGISYTNTLPGVSYAYTYYLDGNMKTQTKATSTDSTTTHYEYNGSSQLTKAHEKTSPDGMGRRLETFEYDEWGNRTKWVENGVETTYTYDVNNRLTQMQRNIYGRTTSTALSYNSRGGLEQKGSIDYNFTPEGKLGSIINGSNIYRFYYDGLGRRRRQEFETSPTNIQSTWYYLDRDWNTTCELNGSGTITKIYFNGLKTIGVKTEGVKRYNYHDNLGSTVSVLNGTNSQNYWYSPYGQEEIVSADFTYTDSPLNHGWVVYTPSQYPGTVSTTFDSTLQNQVMQVQSSYTTNFGIQFGSLANPLNVKKTGLSVKYRANDYTIFFVAVQGKNGNIYYLTYYIGDDRANSVSGEYYFIRLGLETKDGTWRLLERDMNKDLMDGFSTELDKVLLYCVRGGNYYLDDIRLVGKDFSGNTRKYTDMDEDGSGLYYLRNRYYDPELGRFISLDNYRGDITDPLSLNRYIYTKNNPLKYIDPTGNNFIFLNDPDAVIGQGHVALLIGNSDTGYFYYSRDGKGARVEGLDGRNSAGGMTDYFTSLEDFKSSEIGKRYSRQSPEIETSLEQDNAMIDKANELIGEPYNFFTNNCGDLTQDVAKAGGIDLGGSIFGIARPNSIWESLQ